jgi:hypothetical protein
MYGYNNEVTSCLSKHRDVKQYRGVTAPHINDLSTKLRSVISFTPWPLCRWVNVGKPGRVTELLWALGIVAD